MDLNVAVREVRLRNNVNATKVLVQSKGNSAAGLKMMIREQQIDKFKSFINFIVFQ
jgi:hypothetical protein